MAVWEWIRFIGGAALIVLGLIIFFIEISGVFRFKYVLNRMHAAAMGDTLGLSACIAGLMLMNGWNFTTIKLLCVIAFLWLASPVSSHLIAKLEVTTSPDSDQYEKIQDLSTLAEERRENENE
ncbi:MAG: monovalent cation/H(+) antiporter subunit G [Lachnospiraceae bacterium]|nr:monovalent cation/H(+) antiporter subunit G [Lachnospiraceae bacterium]